MKFKEGIKVLVKMYEALISIVEKSALFPYPNQIV